MAYLNVDYFPMKKNWHTLSQGRDLKSADPSHSQSTTERNVTDCFTGDHLKKTRKCLWPFTARHAVAFVVVAGTQLLERAISITRIRFQLHTACFVLTTKSKPSLDLLVWRLSVGLFTQQYIDGSLKFVSSGTKVKPWAVYLRSHVHLHVTVFNSNQNIIFVFTRRSINTRLLSEGPAAGGAKQEWLAGVTERDSKLNYA